MTTPDSNEVEVLTKREARKADSLQRRALKQHKGLDVWEKIKRKLCDRVCESCGRSLYGYNRQATRCGDECRSKTNRLRHGAHTPERRQNQRDAFDMQRLDDRDPHWRRRLPGMGGDELAHDARPDDKTQRVRGRASAYGFVSAERCTACGAYHECRSPDGDWRPFHVMPTMVRCADDPVGWSRPSEQCRQLDDGSWVYDGAASEAAQAHDGHRCSSGHGRRTAVNDCLVTWKWDTHARTFVDLDEPALAPRILVPSLDSGMAARFVEPNTGWTDGPQPVPPDPFWAAAQRGAKLREGSSHRTACGMDTHLEREHPERVPLDTHWMLPEDDASLQREIDHYHAQEKRNVTQAQLNRIEAQQREIIDQQRAILVRLGDDNAIAREVDRFIASADGCGVRVFAEDV